MCWLWTGGLPCWCWGAVGVLGPSCPGAGRGGRKGWARGSGRPRCRPGSPVGTESHLIWDSGAELPGTHPAGRRGAAHRGGGAVCVVPSPGRPQGPGHAEAGWAPRSWVGAGLRPPLEPQAHGPLRSLLAGQGARAGCENLRPCCPRVAVRPRGPRAPGVEKHRLCPAQGWWHRWGGAWEGTGDLGAGRGDPHSPAAGGGGDAASPAQPGLSLAFFFPP